jgi:pSer/pThr/pTyr-binding forkhead associated (FHA) protein
MNIAEYIFRPDFILFIASIMVLVAFTLIRYRRKDAKVDVKSESVEVEKPVVEEKDADSILDSILQEAKKRKSEDYKSPPFEPPIPFPAPVEKPSRKGQATAPVVIQYSSKLNFFSELPVRLRSDKECDFTIDHPAVFGFHAEISFHESQYWIKDLTERNLVTINGNTVDKVSQIMPDSVLSLSPEGPSFRFLGRGRFVEVIEPDIEETIIISPAEESLKPPETVFLSPEKRVDIKPTATRSSDHFILSRRIVVSLAVLGVALYIIIQGTHSGESHEWAYGAAGTVIGYWLK